VRSEDNPQAPDLESLAKDFPTQTLTPPKFEIETTLAHRREDSRRWLAVGLLASYLAMIVGTLILIEQGRLRQDEVKEVWVLLLTSQATLLGSALGYYFGRTAGQG
jgi:membrane protein YqaA with SNARE-associated domain